MTTVRRLNRSHHVRSVIGNARVARPSSGVHKAKPPKMGLVAPQPQKPHPSPQQVQRQANVVTAKAQGGTTMPWDAQAQRETGEALTEEQNALNEIGANWVRREQEYGLGANSATRNPFSEATLLAQKHKREIGPGKMEQLAFHYDSAERRRRNSAGLNLYSGSNVNAERENTGRYLTSYNRLLQAYAAEKAAKEAKKLTAERTYRSIREGAQLGAIQRAAEAAPAPVAPSSSAVQAAPAPVVHRKKQTQHRKVHRRKQTRHRRVGIGNARKA